MLINKNIAFIIIIIIITIPQIYSKCGLEIRSDSKTGSTTSFCNDMEMYEQCKLAQNKMSRFINGILEYLDENNINITELEDYQIPNLQCHLHISCYSSTLQDYTIWFSRGKRWYC